MSWKLNQAGKKGPLVLTMLSRTFAERVLREGVSGAGVLQGDDSSLMRMSMMLLVQEMAMVMVVWIGVSEQHGNMLKSVI